MAIFKCVYVVYIRVFVYSSMHAYIPMIIYAHIYKCTFFFVYIYIGNIGNIDGGNSINVKPE
jgi:hypothetical protein